MSKLTKDRIIPFTVLLVLILLALTMQTAQIAEAESEVITVPHDYSSITEAIDNARDGDSIFIKAGTYEGPINQTIVIDKKLTILGESTERTIIKLYPAYNVTWILTAPFFSYSDAIAIKAHDCKLLNLTLVISNPGGFITAIGNRVEIACNNITSGPSTGIKISGSNCKIIDNLTGGSVQLNGTFNEISRNSIYHIWVYGSLNLIRDNTIQGIGLGNSTSNVVLGNTITSTSRAYSGIDLTFSNNNFLCKNRLSGFSSGFRLWFSSENTIAANTIADSLSSSISFGGSSDNRIYLNNFVDNQFSFSPYIYDNFDDPNYRNAFPNMTLSTNTWDNGTRGNHWSGLNVSDTDGDGISEIPYTINANNQDAFPLVARIETDSINIELPQWAYPTPSPPTSPTPSPSPSASQTSPSQATPPVVSPSPTIALSPSPSIPEFPSWLPSSILVLSLAVLLVSRVKGKSK